MTLRALTATISFKNNASAALKAVDAGVDDVKSGVKEVQKEFKELEKGVGTAAEGAKKSVAEVGNKVDELAAKTDKAGDGGGSVVDFLKSKWTQMGVAVGAAGAAIEAFSRSQEALGLSATRVAYSMGIEDGEIKEIARSVASATFSLEDAYTMMQTGAQLGIKDTKLLASYTKFWGEVAVATGTDIKDLANSATGLQSIGIELGNETEAMSALGYVATQTTMPVASFLKFLQRSGPELRKMNMSIEEAAAVAGALQKELGMTSEMITSEFTQAVTIANGNQSIFLRTLGLTADQLDEYRGAVDDSTGAIDYLNNAAVESMTPIQKLTAGVKTLANKYGGDLLPVLESLAPILGVASSGMMMFAAVQTAGVIPALKATAISVKAMSLAFLTSPIGMIVIALTALIAVIVLVALNFDKIKEAATKAWDGIKNSIGKVVDWIKGIDLKEIGQNIISSLVKGITSGIDKLKQTVKNIGDTIIGGIKGIFGIASPSKVMTEFGVNLGEGLHIGLTKETEAFFNSPPELTAIVQPIDEFQRELKVGLAEDTKALFDAPLNSSTETPTPELDSTVTNVSSNHSVTIGDINVYSNSDNPVDVAREVEKALRDAFGSHAERYFAHQARSV